MPSSWLLSFLQKLTIKTLSLAKIHTWYIWFLFFTLEFQIESEHALTGTNFFDGPLRWSLNRWTRNKKPVSEVPYRVRASVRVFFTINQISWNWSVKAQLTRWVLLFHHSTLFFLTVILSYQWRLDVKNSLSVENFAWGKTLQKRIY